MAKGFGRGVEEVSLERFSTALRNCRRVSEDELTALFDHYRLLLRWNRILNLTRIERIEEAVKRHYAECLFLADLLPSGRLSIQDIGSGAGFPGIPIAVRRPECLVTLVESHQRKAVFLREVSRGMPNVRVLSKRAEEVGEDAEWMVARAVRWQAVLPLVRRDVALLIGAEDSAAAGRQPEFAWEPPVPLPGSRKRVVLVGHRIDRCST